jgi:hypothetical protein
VGTDYIEISKSGFDVCSLILSNYIAEQKINEQLRSGFGPRVTKDTCLSNANYHTGYFVKFNASSKRAFEIVSYVNNPDIGTEAIKYINKTADTTIANIGCVALPGGVGFNGNCNPISPLPPPTWMRQFGTAGADITWRGYSDKKGNTYVPNYTDNAYSGYVNMGSTDIAFTKYNNEGVAILTRQFGTLGQDLTRVITTDDQDNIYIGGLVTGNLPSQVDNGSGDSFIRKYDSTGAELWTRQFGTNGLDQMYDILVVNGSIYVAGIVGTTLSGQVSSGGSDAFIRKYDSSGTELWTRQFGTLATDIVYKLAQDNAGNIYTAGYTTSAFSGFTNMGSADMYIRKYDGNGNVLLTKQWGTDGYDQLRDIAIDTQNNLYIFSYTEGLYSGQSALGIGDSVIHKLDNAGNIIWTRQYGTSGTDYAQRMVLDGVGNIYSGGWTTGNFPNFTRIGGSSDAFIRKYDSNGTELWTRQYGTNNTTALMGISIYAGSIYAAGYTYGAFTGFTNLGSADLYLCKMESSTGTGCN